MSRHAAETAMGPRVLVVEDEALIAEEIQERLTRVGYRSLGVRDTAEQAIRTAEELRPDLVLMDIRLKGPTDGIRAALRIYRDFDIPVVFLSAHSDQATLRRAKAAGPFGYVLKPFHEKTLLVSMETALGRHALERRLRDREFRYAATLQSIADGIVATDVDGRVTFMNPVMETLTGWKFTEVQGLPIEQVFSVVDAADQTPLENPIREALARQGSLRLTQPMILMQRGGAAVRIENAVDIIRSPKGTSLGAVLGSRVIDQRRWDRDTLPPTDEQQLAEQIPGEISTSPDAALRILLVEDTLTDARIVQGFLENGLDVPFELNHVQRLSDAVRRLAERSLDLVLVDLTLPDSSGLDTFRDVQQAAGNVPVVVLTGTSDENLAVEAVRQGAQDYLIKGQYENNALVRSVRFAIERHRRRRAEARMLVTQQQFDAAREIQQALLPEAAPELPGFDIDGACRPAEATGGDYFDYVPMRDGRWGIVLADVSSHGFAPALIMAGTRRVLRTLTDYHDDLGELLTKSGQAVFEDTQDQHFVTLFFAELDPSTRTVRYAGAAHAGYLLDRHGQCRQLPSTSLPLGVMEDEVVECGDSFALEPGDILLLMSDGFQEAQNRDGELFGIDRVLKVVGAHREDRAREIVESLLDAVDEFCAPETPQDDVTVVVVKSVAT